MLLIQQNDIPRLLFLIFPVVPLFPADNLHLMTRSVYGAMLDVSRALRGVLLEPGVYLRIYRCVIYPEEELFGHTLRLILLRGRTAQSAFAHG